MPENVSYFVSFYIYDFLVIWLKFNNMINQFTFVMSPIDPEYEKVLNFFYQNIESPTGIGVNEIRDHFPLSNERVSTVIKRLEV